MNILVTGGAGFIGSHLVSYCLARGWNVTVLDLFTKRALSAYIHQNQAQTKGMLQAHSVDLSDASVVDEKYFRHIDWVFHVAGKSDIVPSIRYPVSYHRTNVTATLNVLEASRKARVKRFVYAASSSCYGIPTIYPTPETAPIKPVYPYALTKYIGELYVLTWSSAYVIPAVSLRLFNVYGPRVRVSDDYGPVFSTFLPQKLTGMPFTIVGDGTQQRDFIYVSDVVDAFIAAARSDVSSESFNVGTGRPQRVNRLVQLLGGGEVVYLPKRPGEPECTWADIGKIRRVLGWKPKVDFEQGVGRVLADIDHWKHAPVWTPRTIRKATREWFSYLSD